MESMDSLKTVIDLRRLAYIERFNLLIKLHPQNVAVHSLFTAYLTLYLAKHLNLNIDVGRAFIYATFHDVDEAYLGDIILPTKNGELGRIYEETAVKIRRQVASIFNIDTDLTDMEKAIVKLADMLEAYIYALEEIRLGNGYFKKVAFNYHKRIIEYIRDKLPAYQTRMEQILQKIEALVMENGININMETHPPMKIQSDK